MVRPALNSRECFYSHSPDEKTNTQKGSVTTNGITRKRPEQNSAQVCLGLCPVQVQTQLV